MTRGLLAAAVLVLLVTAGGAGAYENYNTLGEWEYNAENPPGGCPRWTGGGSVYMYSSASSEFKFASVSGATKTRYREIYNDGADHFLSYSGWLTLDDTWQTNSYSGGHIMTAGDSVYYVLQITYDHDSSYRQNGWYYVNIVAVGDNKTVSGSTNCIDYVNLFKNIDSTYKSVDIKNVNDTGDSYEFDIVINGEYRLVFSDGTSYDFTCTENEVFNYDACLYVYGYTCGINSIKLYNDSAGWVLDDTDAQSGGRENYEMVIDNGESYLISFIDRGTVCQNQTFACTGDHVLIDYDRCEYLDRSTPYAPPYALYLWTGYDYNIVTFKDEHENFIENSKVAIYDNTDSAFIQKWTDTRDGYALLGTRYDADHNVMLMLRTFDGIFTLDTTYPANGTAAAGDENITMTNWTIPIHYNVDIYPVDQASVPLLDVFCGLAEYTPLDPLSFWGFSMSGSQHVPVTNCSGFSMCDIRAEKGGYETYEETALNWTSKSALTKDYRHTATLTKE